MRILGPVAGFVLGALATRLYINPFSPPPDYGPGDPRWLGAWWLGMLIISCCLFFVAIVMFGFPRSLNAATTVPTTTKVRWGQFPRVCFVLLKKTVLKITFNRP